jgi:transcriptional regulator with XRE-family HTH domain
MDALANRLREALKERHVSQEALARACHVSLRTAHRWVNGDAQPRYGDLLAIARVLDIDPDELLEEADPAALRRRQFVARISTREGLLSEIVAAMSAGTSDGTDRRARDRRGLAA